MNILMTINEKYIEQLNILLNSIQLSNKDENFNVYILYMDSLDKKADEIKRGLDLSKMSINLIHVSESDVSFCPVYEKRYPLEIYLRIFATRYLPENLDRILYLDADTLVINKLDELYNMEFEGNYYIATTHIQKLLHKFNEIRLNITEDEPYINTGVLLINLEELRKIQIEEMVVGYVKKNKRKLMLPDQDIITAIFGDKIKLVDELKYNLGDRSVRLYNLKHVKEPIDIEWIERNTVIIHYYGRNKPWNDDYFGILGDFYHKVERKVRNIEE